MAKSEDPKDQAKMHEIIFCTSEAVRTAAILLQPVMPAKMCTLLDMLGVRADKRSFKDAAMGRDLTYGTPLVYPKFPGEWNSLFPPPAAEE